VSRPAVNVRDTARQAADSDWLTRAARLGLAARGLIYVLLGILAMQVARGSSARTDQTGALDTIAEQPFGQTLLWVVAGGLLAFGLWRIAEGIWGRRGSTDEKRRTLERVVSACSGLINIALGVLAARIALGGGGGGNGRTVTARLLDAPGGKMIMVVAGLVVIGVGIGLAWFGLKTDFERELTRGAMGTRMYAVVRRLGQVGYVARGLVVGLVGALVIDAALNQDPNQATGLDVALKSLAEAPFGPVLLVVAAAGLICFGVYSFAEVRYRRLGPVA
jgi:hypothetical protein